MATERRRMQLKRSQPGSTLEIPTEGRSMRAPNHRIRRVRRIVLPFLILVVAACGGDDGGDEPTDGGDPGPPTADEIRGERAAVSGPSAPSESDPSEASATESQPSESGSSESGSSTSGTTVSSPAPSTEGSASASSDPGGPPYAVQLGAFDRESNARRLQQSLEDADLPVWTGETGTSGRALLRVRVGATTTVADARRLVDAIRDRLPDAPDSVWIAPLGTEGGAPEEMMTATRGILDDG